MPPLSEFFQKPHYERALARYVEVAQAHKWSIEHKLDMYTWAKIAFDTDHTVGEQRRAFQRIYEHLKRGWHVFRKAPLGYWSADETFDGLIRECHAFSRQSGLTLLTFRSDSLESEQVLAGLTRLRNLKRTKWYPWMAVSKFTHFFNPMLFPIFDDAVIWQVVLNGAFRNDYRQWCATRGVSPLETDPESARFNVTYTLMAGDMIRSADTHFMGFFGEWFNEQVAGANDEQHVLDEISQYYATAFEFVAIGAAHLNRT